jgi:hypothetical protein
MMRRQILGLLVLTGAALTLPACTPQSTGDETRETMGGGKIYPTYRYRLTVEVDTPEGLKTGSSVIEVQTRRASKNAIPSPRMLSYKVRGEAVTVDLGQRGLLFALLRSEISSSWAGRAFEMMAPPTPRDEAIGMDDEYGYRRARALALKGPQVIPRHIKGNYGAQNPKPSDPSNAWPMLVRFLDIADPKTLAKVDPDALAVSFGKGVKLRRITVERTEDAVTAGIDRWLTNEFWQRWFAINDAELKRPGGAINNPYFKTFRAQISRNDFSKELKK